MRLVGPFGLALALTSTLPAQAADQYKGGFPIRDQPAYLTELNVYVVTTCDESRASFIVVNDGEKWPAVANVRIASTAGDVARSERRMVMLMDQTVRFYVDKATEEFGLTIEPTWFKRERRIDARVKCD